MYYTLTNSQLSFIFEGTEHVLALRAKVGIEKKSIISIEWHDVFSEWGRLLVRMPGSYLPRWIMAGSYWTEDGWDFVFAKRPRGVLRPILHNVVVVTTDKPRYRRLIIETDLKNAQEIKAWWEGTRDSRKMVRVKKATDKRVAALRSAKHANRFNGK